MCGGDGGEVRGREYRWGTVVAALLVRGLLVLHSCLAVWRVVVTRDHRGYWALAALNIPTLVETVMVMRRNAGCEWKWWCPCFLSYLVSALPSVWLLQLSQYDAAVGNLEAESAVQQRTSGVRLVQTTSPATTLAGNTTFNMTTSTSTTQAADVAEDSLAVLLQFHDDTWIVLIQESLMYLLVFGRWVLPRGDVSRDALSDLLLEYLAMASDIMELYALFDEDIVLTNLDLTFAILAVWSCSFFQFVPVLIRKNKYRQVKTMRIRRITRACGSYFAEVVVTCSSIFLQDLPFMILRLYIIVGLGLTTYSLIFFVLKNMVTLLLLFYRLGILCIRLPCCYRDECDEVGVESVDFSHPVAAVHGNHVHENHVHDNKLPAAVFRTPTTFSSLSAQKFTFADFQSYH